MNKLKKSLKYLLIIGIIVVLIGVIFNLYKKNYGVEDIKAYIISFGIFAPVIYIIMFALVPLTLFPDSILAISGGLVFGLIKGYIFTAIGALIGASISFMLARILGRDFVVKFSKNKLQNVEKIIGNNGFLIIVLLRLIPLFPFDIISYGAGVSNVKYKEYILATFIGTIPGILVFTNIGAQWVNVGKTSFYISIASLIFLFLMSIFLKHRFLDGKVKDIQKGDK